MLGLVGLITASICASCAQQRPTPVPAVALDTIPRALIQSFPIVTDSGGRQLRTELVIVGFIEGTSQQLRQAAVDAVGGEVIGGSRIGTDEGDYYLRVRSATTASKLLDTFFVLEALPQVAVTYLFDTASPPQEPYRRPNDRPGLTPASSEAPPVPALAPDSIPTSLINSLALLTNSAGKQLRSELVVLRFHEGTSQALRQAVISRVSGVVVGGQAGIQMEGWYLIRVVTATTVAAIDSVVNRLRMVPSVAVAGSFIVGLPNDQSWLKLATGTEAASVPAIAPDTLPPGLINSLPNITDSANRTIKSQIVMVQFREGTAQALREAAVNAVSGQVIGGIRVPIGEGLYYLRITTASTASALHAAASILHALPHVAVVYLLDAVPMDQQSSDGCARFQVRLNAGGSPIIEPMYASGVSSYCSMNELKLLSDTAGTFDQATGTLRLAVVMENIGTAAVIPRVKLRFNADSVIRLDAQGNPVPETPNIVGYQPDSASANGRNAYWFFDQSLASSGQPQVLMPGARTQRRWLEFRGTGWTDRVRLKLFATGAEASSVPALAPDTLPGELINSLPNVTDGANRTLKSQLVLVKFREGTSQTLREAAVNAVSGQVIGGIRVPINEGVYYLRISSASTASALHRAFSILHGLPHVAVVYLLDTIPQELESYSVPAVAPDSIPRALLAKVHHPRQGLEYVHDLLIVGFRLGTTLVERTRVLSLVAGAVVGGLRDHLSEGGAYVIRLPNDSTQTTLRQAEGVLADQPSVRRVSRYFAVPVQASFESALPVQAPDTIPLSLIQSLALVPDSASNLLRSEIVLIRFLEGTSKQMKQAAIDAVGGEVVRGQRSDPDEGVYYVRIRTATTASRLLDAFDILEALPQVAVTYLLNTPTSVPAIAPDSFPDSLVRSLPLLTDAIGNQQRSELIVVLFHEGTSQSTRQAVVARVNGVVVGGQRMSQAEGWYLLRVASAATVAGIDSILTILEGEPSVDVVGPFSVGFPNSHPAGLFDASNVVNDSATTGGPILKNTAIVTFHPGATQAHRQALLDSVGGTVIGGGKTSSTTGFYYVRVEAIRTVGELHAVVTRLKASSHVDEAAVVLALHIPAEAPSVPAFAPDSVPRGLFADSNLVADPDLPGVRYVKRLVSVLFKATATAADRQAAIAVVGGVVIGGVRILGSDGYYLIRLVADTSVRGPKNAVALLESLPAVDQAFVERVSTRPTYLRRPRESNEWRQ